jgi:hypothetical protein
MAADGTVPTPAGVRAAGARARREAVACGGLPLPHPPKRAKKAGARAGAPGCGAPVAITVDARVGGPPPPHHVHAAAAAQASAAAALVAAIAAAATGGGGGVGAPLLLTSAPAAAAWAALSGPPSPSRLMPVPAPLAGLGLAALRGVDLFGGGGSK